MAVKPIRLMLLLASLLIPWSATAQTGAGAAPPSAPFVTGNRTLQASLDRLARGSRLWRDAEADVRSTGRRVLLITSEQVALAADEGFAREAFDPTVLAEAHPILDQQHRIALVVVVVNLSLLVDGHHRRGSVPVEFDADLDRILIHEVYGHAVPYLLAGDTSGRCPDPVAGARATDACSIQRENRVREELGLGRRTAYDLSDLALARRGWR